MRGTENYIRCCSLEPLPSQGCFKKNHKKNSEQFSKQLRLEQQQQQKKLVQSEIEFGTVLTQTQDNIQQGIKQWQRTSEIAGVCKKAL